MVMFVYMTQVLSHGSGLIVKLCRGGVKMSERTTIILLYIFLGVMSLLHYIKFHRDDTHKSTRPLILITSILWFSCAILRFFNK